MNLESQPQKPEAICSVISTFAEKGKNLKTFSLNSDELIKDIKELVLQGRSINSVTHFTVGKIRKLSRPNIHKIVQFAVSPDYEESRCLEMNNLENEKKETPPNIGERIAFFEQLKFLENKFASFSSNGRPDYGLVKVKDGKFFINFGQKSLKITEDNFQELKISLIEQGAAARQ